MWVIVNHSKAASLIEPIRPKGQRFFLHRAANCSSPEALTVVPTAKTVML